VLVVARATPALIGADAAAVDAKASTTAPDDSPPAQKPANARSRSPTASEPRICSASARTLPDVFALRGRKPPRGAEVGSRSGPRRAARGSERLSRTIDLRLSHVDAIDRPLRSKTASAPGSARAAAREHDPGLHRRQGRFGGDASSQPPLGQIGGLMTPIGALPVITASRR